MTTFKVGDRVRILSTANEKKYEDEYDGPGWSENMQREVGMVGVVSFAGYAGPFVDVKTTATDTRFAWRIEDLELVTEKTTDMKQGLKQGDACKEFTASQKKYALDRAKELGIAHADTLGPEYDRMIHGPGRFLAFGGKRHVGVTACLPGSTVDEQVANVMTFLEFMERMENTVIEKPLMVNGHEVMVRGFDVIIGCYRLTAGEVKVIHDRCFGPIVVKGHAIRFSDIEREITFGDGKVVSYDDVKAVAEKMGLTK